MERLDTLAEVFQEDHEEILRELRARVRNIPNAKHLDRLTLEDGFRAVLDEISNSLMVYHDTGELPRLMAGAAPVEHGLQRYNIGFDVRRVIVEYNMLRHVLQDSAERHNIPLTGVAGHVLHEIIDTAVAGAVDTYMSAQAADTAAKVEARLATVVHDLKTPLSAIRTASVVIEGRLSPESKKAVSTMLGIVLRNCENLNTMLMKMLEESSKADMVLRTDINSAEFQFRHVVDELVYTLKPLVEKTGVPIENNVAPDLTVKGDPFLLKQMLQNLLSNSIKYTSQGRISIGAVREGDRVRIWVQDTGVGMPPEKVQGLFTEADRDPTKPESTGIGLSIVKNIVDAHKGRIEVHSMPGKGSTFTITLPI
jgi:signal transduction histidine kinase